jgi:hypothetical protein
MLPTRRACRCRSRARSYTDEDRAALVPQAAEVESARLLANDARQALLAAGLSDAAIDRLADDFVAEDRGEATDRFIDWPSGSTAPHAVLPAPLLAPGGSSAQSPKSPTATT